MSEPRLFRTAPNGETFFLDKDARKLEAVALALGKEGGFKYTGDDLLGYAEINSRAAHFVRMAEAAIKAYKAAK